ncbi:MAG: DUF89 family protein [Kiritimatiellae bacterium]|nr:DUF89 family protein [Kiritimatiellia bacterium]
MKACLDCLPCLARNAIDLARKSARGDAALEAEIARSGMEILGCAAAEGYLLPPPCYARQLINNALEKSGSAVPDPWAQEKEKSTELALKLMGQMGLSAADPSASLREKGSMSDFERRLRLSIAGNVLDFSIYSDLDIAAAMETMATAFEKPVDGAAVAELKRRMDEATSILWIFDNCGEAVFDRLLMEPYRDKLTLAVRGKPAFNDVTRAELEASGFSPDFAKGGVVSNDDGVPGVVDSTCGEKFRMAFSSADLIVAKGQANFETMNERTDKPIAFLFLAKCPVVCRAIGAEPKTIQVILSR